MKTMKNIMAALCCLFALTLWTGCSGDDDGDNNNPKPAATTLYRGSLVLESWIDSTKIAEEMPRIEETFLQYLGVKSLKNFTVEQYQAELAKIVNGEIVVDNNSEMSNPTDAELSNVKVNFVG